MGRSWQGAVGLAAAAADSERHSAALAAGAVGAALVAAAEADGEAAAAEGQGRLREALQGAVAARGWRQEAAAAAGVAERARARAVERCDRRQRGGRHHRLIDCRAMIANKNKSMLIIDDNKMPDYDKSPTMIN